MSTTSEESSETENERWVAILLHEIHAELKKSKNMDPRLILVNEILGAAIHVAKTHDHTLEKVSNLLISLQERSYQERIANAMKVRDLQLKITELKKLRPADKKTQDGVITRCFLEKMVAIEEDKQDSNWLKGTLKIFRLELEKKGQRLELLHADADGENEEVRSAREYAKTATTVISETKEINDSKKELRRIYDGLLKKQAKKETECTEAHKEIFQVIETLDLLSDDPIYFPNMPEEARRIVESYQQKEAEEKTNGKPEKPAAAEIEEMENYSKRLEISSNILKQQHKHAVDQLEGDFARNVTEVKEKYEGFKKKYEEEVKKGREKDREIQELKEVRDGAIRKLAKANKRQKRIDAMVFLNENIHNVYNSIDYKDGVVAALDRRFRNSENERIMDMQKFLIDQKNFALECLEKYEPHNTQKREAILEEYKKGQEEIRPLEEQLIAHQARMNEYRRNEAWVNQTRKCVEINEGHLKTFITEVPRNVNRLKLGRMEPDSLEAQLFDVKAWAKECLRFKQLADTLLAQRKKMDADFTNLVILNNKMARDIAILQYRHKTIEKIVEQKVKENDLMSSKVVQSFFMSMIHKDPAYIKMIMGTQEIVSRYTQGAGNVAVSEAPEASETPEATVVVPQPSVAGEQQETADEFTNLMPLLRALYSNKYDMLLSAIVPEIQHMRQQKRAGLPMCDDANLATIAIALHEHQQAKAEVMEKFPFEDMSMRSHWSFRVNPEAQKWKLNETVETRMIKEMHEKILELEGSLVEVTKKLEEKEKEVSEKTNHVRIVEAVYLRGRYGKERVQVSPPGRSTESGSQN